MKKLMIAAAIVCAAAFAQAAALNWEVYNISDAGGNVLQEDPGLYLAKVISGENVIVSGVGSFEYDSGENDTTGTYLLTMGVDANGDVFTVVNSDGQAVTSAGTPMTYTLSGFDSDVATISPLFFDSPTAPSGVPEPTSGLLLLLGVAGLALKRKRA